MLSKIYHLILFQILWIISIIPLRLLYIKSFLISNIFFYRKDIIRSNINSAFNKTSKQGKRKIYYNFRRYFINLILEIVKMISADKNFYKRRIKINNLSILDEYYDKKQSIILMMGHHNNWEWAGQIISIRSKQKFVSVYKKLSNLFFDNLMSKIRERNGTKVIEMNDIIKYLYEDKECKIIGLIADQNPVVNNNTQWIDFFNQNVPVINGPEKIARKMNFPVLFCNMKKINDGYYDITLEHIHDNPKFSDQGDITKKFFKRLEKQINDDPNNYLWSHNRWKHKK